MIREKLVQEYRNIIDRSYPDLASLLANCYITIIDGCLNPVSQPYYYLGVYYSGMAGKEIIFYKKELKRIAEDLGLVEVIFVNAKRLIRDPLCHLKYENPRLWLELYWVATQIETNLD